MAARKGSKRKLGYKNTVGDLLSDSELKSVEDALAKWVALAYAADHPEVLGASQTTRTPACPRNARE
jgi:hypothetical protein